MCLCMCLIDGVCISLIIDYYMCLCMCLIDGVCISLFIAMFVE